VDLVKGTKSTSPCPDRRQFPQLETSGPRRNAYKRGHTNQSSLPKGRTPRIQFPQLEASGPCRNAYKRGHTNQSSLPKGRTHKIRGFDPLRRAAAGCTTSHHHTFLNAAAASGSRSTSSPTVCDSRSLYSGHVALDQSQISFKFIPARSDT
jgi:hypothetical protein